MIEKLQNKKKETSKKIQAVFQESYKIEAEIINAIDFPPLKRPLEDYIKSNTEFYGYLKNGDLAGIIEISHNNIHTHIQSLVVSPRFFRQGIASNLMEFTFNKFDSNLFVVETAVANKPASKLYKNLGFKEVKQWDTEHGIRKIKFELEARNQ